MNNEIKPSEGIPASPSTVNQVKRVKPEEYDIPVEPIMPVIDGKPTLQSIGIVQHDEVWAKLESLASKIGTPGRDIRPGVIMLPTEAMDYVTDAALTGQIVAFIDKYLELRPGHNLIVAAYIKMTWVYDAFPVIPYLSFRHPSFGRGKSRALDIVGSLSYRGSLIGGGPTVASLRRFVDAVRGTLCLDEADFPEHDDVGRELMRILREGNEAGRPYLVSRKNGKDEWDPTTIEVFGPKVFAHHYSHPNVALESRKLDILMPSKLTRKDEIPSELPFEFHTEARELRNKLLTYRIRNLKTVAQSEVVFPRGLKPRLRQVAKSVMTISDDVTREKIIQLLLETQVRLDALSDEDDMVSVARAIITLESRNGTSRIRLSDIAMEAGLGSDSSRDAGKLVRRAGIPVSTLTGNYQGVKLRDTQRELLQSLIDEAEEHDPELN